MQRRLPAVTALAAAALLGAPLSRNARRVVAKTNPKPMDVKLQTGDPNPRQCPKCAAEEIRILAILPADQTRRIVEKNLPPEAVFTGVPTAFGAECACGWKGLRIIDEDAAVKLRATCPDVPGWPELAPPPTTLDTIADPS